MNVTVSVFPVGVTSLSRVTANADLVAFQDGDGDWTEATGTGGVYPIAVTSTRYAVAVGCRGAGVEFYYQSLAEASTLAVDGCVRLTDTADVMVTVTGAPADFPAPYFWVGDTGAFAEPGQVTTVTVNKGVQDIFVVYPAYRAPSIDIEADQALTIDVGQAHAEETFPLTIDEPMIASEEWSWAASYVMPHSRTLQSGDSGFSSPGVYSTLAAPQRQPGDVVRVSATQTIGNDGAGSLRTRSVVRDMTVPAAVTLTPAPAISMMAPAIDTDAVSQLTVTLPVTPATLGHIRASASFVSMPDALSSSRYQRMFVRPGWSAGSARVTLPTPDLRNLSSWNPDMELQARNPVAWELTVTDQDQPFDAPLGDRNAIESGLSGMASPPRTP